MERALPRFAYCKHGDAVEELEAVGPAPVEVPAGGPRHYVTTFLHLAKGRPTLLLSLSRRDAHLLRGNVRARAVAYDSGPRHPLRSALVQTRAFLVILGALLRFRPTSILCAAAGGPPLWACHLAARLQRVPLVCTRHTSLRLPGRNPLRRLRRTLNAYVLRRSTCVLCHGPLLADELRGAGIPPQRLLRFDLSYGHLLRGADDAPYPLPEGLAGPPLRVLFVGRIGWEKGVFDLFDAMQPLLRERPAVQLLYAGDGRDLPALARRVDKGRLRARVLLLGAVEHRRLPALLRAAHVVVTPTRASSTESRCKVAVEALVVGRPVIAPGFGPFPYLVTDGANGLLYTPDSVPDLRRALRRVIDEPGLRDRLTGGARHSGCDYLAAPVGFAQALHQAFAAARTPLRATGG